MAEGERRPHCEATPTKRKYLDEAAALRASERHVRVWRMTVKRAYECDACGYWHLTGTGQGTVPGEGTTERGNEDVREE